VKAAELKIVMQNSNCLSILKKTTTTKKALKTKHNFSASVMKTGHLSSSFGPR